MLLLCVYEHVFVWVVSVPVSIYSSELYMNLCV